MITKPMLAVDAKDVANIKLPVLATPKLDGIRCVKVGGKALSRSFKAIPNKYVRGTIEKIALDGMDGEIVCPGKTFNETQSLIMTEDGEPSFVYMVFDYVKGSLNKAYNERMDDLADWWDKFKTKKDERFQPVFPMLIKDLEFLAQYEADCVEDGFEGVMVRAVTSPYKCGRSTLKEGYLLKIKRFQDAEAEVIGFEERMTNNNVLTTNELGYAKRSTHKENLVPAGTLGTLLVRDLTTKLEFGIGTGFDDATRLEIWSNREKYLGKIVTYQFQPSGMKEKPRFPSFRGFRDPKDM